MTQHQNNRVIAAMSGGVDSTVTAAILKEEGYDVIGLFMRNGVTHKDADTRHQGCCSVDDAMDARRAAEKLDIPFYAVNFKEDFGELIDRFVEEYNQGRTPNPCITCNRTLKFGELMTYADELDAEKIATGHYAKRVQHNGRYGLGRGEDEHKDQSYVLFPLSQKQLKRSMFPLGNHEKSTVRSLAESLELDVHDKPDSTEICFVPGQDYRTVLHDHAPEAIEEGPILNMEGEQLGTHSGHQHFTIGQRRGLGIAVGEPRYVVDIDPDENTIVVGPREEVYSSEFIVDEPNWVTSSPQSPGDTFEARVQIRSHHNPVPSLVKVLESKKLHVELEEPEYALAPGQAAVFYKHQKLLAGGWICRNQ